MNYPRTGLAMLVAALVLSATSPAFAVFGVCVARDSDGRSYVSRQPSVFDWQAKNFAQSLAMAGCQARSQHPASCKIISCTVTK
jgi:hypothetical protein